MQPTVSSPSNNTQSFPEYTWKEHHRLFTRVLWSWRSFGIFFGISIILAFTVGIVFQIIFVFSILRAFTSLALISQPFYSAFLFIFKDNRLPHHLPKPPASAIIWSMVELFISVFFLFIGIYAVKITGFCPQSIGCIFVKIIR